MIVLTVAHLKKSFGVETVLKDVSLALHQGERLGLVGANGSGKTTLLRILSGRLAADEGQIAMQKGMVVGYLEQSYQPQPGTTVRQELERVYEPIFRMEAPAPAGLVRTGAGGQPGGLCDGAARSVLECSA